MKFNLDWLCGEDVKKVDDRRQQTTETYLFYKLTNKLLAQVS